MKDKLRTEKENIESEFEKLQQFLKEKKQTLHEKLEQLEKRITMVENANIAKMFNQITSLNALIMEIEKKCETPAWELLKDAKSTLSRYDNVRLQCPELGVKRCKVMVTLDPDTAHPMLFLSEEGRRVRWTDRAQVLPDTPKRFTYYPCVLGSKGFTSGRYYWEVQLLQNEEGWNVGVAAESVNRQRFCTSTPETGIWAVMSRYNYYQALTSPETLLSPRERPLKLGVYLDYEGGQLSLYNADSMELLFTFQQASFTERLFPYFYFYGTGLRLV